MAEYATITVPKIQNATIAKNPVTINEKVMITVKVAEENIIVYGEEHYAGEFAAGEV